VPKPREVWRATLTGGDGKIKDRFVLVLSKPIVGTKNVIVATLSSQILNARPTDVQIVDTSELIQSGLSKPSYISTSYLITLQTNDLTRAGVAR
jgi:hypothetical protein